MRRPPSSPRQSRLISACFPRASRSATGAWFEWWSAWISKDSATEGFGHCTNHGECQAACPKGISIETIARMNRDYMKGALRSGCES